MAFKTDAQRRWFFANRGIGRATSGHDPRTKTGRALEIERAMRKEWTDEMRGSASRVREERAALDARLKRGEISQEDYATEVAGLYQGFSLDATNMRDRFAAIAQVAQREQEGQRTLTARESLDIAWDRVARDNFDQMSSNRRSPHSVLAETTKGEEKLRHQYYAAEGPFERKAGWQWRRGDNRPESVKRENERLSGGDRFFWQKAQSRAQRLTSARSTRRAKAMGYAEHTPFVMGRYGQKKR